MSFVQGRLHSPAYALVERDFSGLCWGRISPTDIDLFLDFDNRLFVLCEAKLHGCNMSTGQRLAFERLCDACNRPPKRFALGCLVAHDGSPCFDYAQARIVRFRWHNEWLVPACERKLREFIDTTLAHIERWQCARNGHHGS